MKFSVPGKANSLDLELPPGSSVIFVGANGGGKTRLAVHIENEMNLNAHRISAHRALSLNPSVPKINERHALSGLRTGRADDNFSVEYRSGHRWRSNAAVTLLNDFDYLIQALFADQSNVSLIAYNKCKSGEMNTAKNLTLTKLDKLKEIWERLLPDRELHISGDNIRVSIQGSEDKYPASAMSDGERAIFYLIGQTLVAAPDSALIIDEPELHVHRSILSRLWDELEAERKDCVFVFITHDLEFSASRFARKFVIRSFSTRPYWELDEVPEDTGFDEEITTLILGSRDPVLFTEGTNDSLDCAIYRCCYPEWMVVPCGSCADVIHSVTTMRNHLSLSRIHCVGVIDSDSLAAADRNGLMQIGIYALPVAEIENIVLLPNVCRAIARSEGFRDDSLEEKVHQIAARVFERLSDPEERRRLALRYCKRRVDEKLKRIDLSDQTSVGEIAERLVSDVSNIDVVSLFEEVTGQIDEAISNRDLEKILMYYDNKGLIADAASILKSCHRDNFLSWLSRNLLNEKDGPIASAIKSELPKLAAVVTT